MAEGGFEEGGGEVCAREGEFVEVRGGGRGGVGWEVGGEEM